jgi:Tfp pilus assembly protein PilE
LAKLLQSRRGEGYVDVIVVVLVIMLFIALAVRVFPVFIAKNQLDTFAAELVREAEIAGRVGGETTAKANQLKTQIGIDPTISWSRTGNIQLNNEVTLTLTLRHDIGFFSFGSFPITLTSKATGKSEVYWK